MDQEKSSFPPVSFDEFAKTSYEAWKAEATASLKGGDFDKKLLTKTYEGITLQPIYTQADVDALDGPATYPGARDFLRGAHAAGYLGGAWDIAQAAEAADPIQANALIREELERGATCVNVALGECGIAVNTVQDIKALLSGVDVSCVRLHIQCGASARKTLGLLEEAGFDLAAASGCIGADPIGTLAKTGTLSKSIDALYDDMAQSVRFTAQKAPGLRTVMVDGNVYANGGACAAREVACCLSTASAYLTAMAERGVDIDTAAKSLRFCFSLGANFFMETAKLRAARVVFAQMAAAFGATGESLKLQSFARTSAFTKTIYDPYVNILRATTEAFSGVVGGVDAMQIAPLDEAYGESEELSRRVARNIQIMLQEEFNLLQPVDPAGGSWYVEALTDELAKAIWTQFQKIEAGGGILAALRSGTMQAEIAKALESRFNRLATRAERAVGTNMYANVLEKRLERNPKPASAGSGAPAAETVTPIAARRWTERFEELRAGTERYEAKTGKTVDVFLANMGPIPQHKARADFACGFFEVAHFNMLRNDGFATVEEAAEAAEKSGAAVAVICSTDATYPELVPPLAALIKQKAPQMKVILAGAPAPEYKDSYVAAGVDDFIHVRANCYEILTNIQKARGIL